MVASASTEHSYWLALAFVAWNLRFSFTQRTQRMQHKRLRLNGNRALVIVNMSISFHCLVRYCVAWRPIKIITLSLIASNKGKGRFPLPELTARVDGCQKMHPSSRAVNSARELGPWTQVVETDLKGDYKLTVVSRQDFKIIHYKVPSDCNLFLWNDLSVYQNMYKTGREMFFFS